jgi:CHAD domain-containing protein
MSRRSVLDTVFTHRMTTFATVLPQSLTGEPEAVHQARVASRRLREVLPVMVLAGARVDRRLRRAVRRVTRALGPVREMDVSLALYAELTATAPVHALADAAVRQLLTTGRAKALRSARKAVTPARQAAMWSALEGLQAEPRANAADVVAGAAARAERRAAKARRAAAKLGVLYEADRLHRVRIAIKRWRYALEVTGELRRARTSAALSQLRTLQDLLGRAHDLHVLGDHVRRAETDLVVRSRPAARDLRRLARAIDEQCRHLHGLFLGRRDAVAATAGTVAVRTPRSRTAA